MSTQKTASWCLFHALCRYCAWRGTLKSITSGSLWLLSIGSPGRKNTVCLLLKLWPPGINPELMIECKLKAHPTWFLYWKKPSWITTLSCNEGWIRLRLECPWRARKYTIVPEESVQYWNLLLFPPPPAKHTFHLLSDQWGECGNWIWRFSLILQKWIAPSSSRCTCCEWRRRNVTFFDTSLLEKEYFPGSISIQFLLSMGTILGEEPAGFLLCGFAFAFDRHAKSFASSFNAYSSSWTSGISVSLLFKFITNLLIHEKF